MRDFSDGALDGMRHKNWLQNGIERNGEAMTEQGFKRFRRKAHSTPPAAPAREEASHALPEREPVAQEPVQDPKQYAEPQVSAPLQDLEPEPMLPATLPEPWDVLRQVQVEATSKQLRQSPLISFFRSEPASKSFDLLRTRLLQTLKERGWSRVAVVSPTSGCGATFTAVNLALSLARVPGSRTILMDLNHRNPGVAKMLDLKTDGDMPAFLAGEVHLEEHLVKCSETLAVGTTAEAIPHAAELLHDEETGITLDFMCQELNPDVVLYDLPPMLEHDDLMAFLPHLDGVLLVADGTKTKTAHLEECERVLDNQAQLLGVVLNRGRDS